MLSYIAQLCEEADRWEIDVLFVSHTNMWF